MFVLTVSTKHSVTIYININVPGIPVKKRLVQIVQIREMNVCNSNRTFLKTFVTVKNSINKQK